MIKSSISALAFDLDGTLYPNYRFYIKLIPFLIRHNRLLYAMGKARNHMRDRGHGHSFFDEQARIMGEILGEDADSVHARTETLIYRGWEPLFAGVKLFAGAENCLTTLRNAGYRLALLSDFPPEAKLKFLKLDSYFDVVLGSETCGRLKPDPLPFNCLAEKLKLSPEQILYVGNSVAYDVVGAKNAGMKTAIICSPLKKLFSRKIRHSGADFIFTKYRQLQKFMVN